MFVLFLFERSYVNAQTARGRDPRTRRSHGPPLPFSSSPSGYCACVCGAMVLCAHGVSCFFLQI